MSRDTVPERQRWAVDLLTVQPGDRILEIGCGRGVAVSLICDRLVDGHVLAMDRSATMVAAARTRNAAYVRDGRATVTQATLAELTATGEPFTKALAVNVNLFWVRPCPGELAVLRALLRPGGALYLCYEPPDAARLAELETRLSAALTEGGFDVTSSLRAGERPLLCVQGRIRSSPPAP